MKNVYGNLSLKNKIATIIISMVVVIAVLGLYLSFKHENEFIIEKLVEEKILTARIVGSYTATDLAFNNKESAVVSMSYLESDVSIINVHLFNEKGEYFASLYQEKDIPKLTVSDGSQHIFSGAELLVSEPITVDNELFGYILLQASTKAYAEDYERNIRYFILLFLGLAVIVVLIAGPMAALVTAPIHQLVIAARKVSKENDYITTLEVKNNDEIGELVAAFNEMLLQIQLREGERDRANLSLKDNEELLRVMLHSMVIGVITIDAYGAIRSFNHAAEIMFGYSEKDVINEAGIMLFPLEQRSRFESEIDYYKTSGSLGVLASGIESKGLTRDGDEFPLYLTVAEMLNPNTDSVNFIISCEDITNKKLQDEQIKRTQRMDALGNLTGGVAHDYNNMLGVMLGYTELLMMNEGMPKELISYVEEISTAGDRAKKLTSKLLAFSKQVSTESKAVNINDILNNDKNMIERTLTVKIKLNYELQEGLWNVWMDSGDFEDAIVNISINAMHAMNNEGVLIFNTKNIMLSEIESSAVQLESGEYVLLRITDTGKGMDEATRVRIFEPFFSTKEDKGTGLGLSQVYGFVKRTKGEIKVYSEPGRGTHFDFYFPRYHAEVQKDEMTPGVEDSAKYNGTESILVVDDEEGLRNLASELLGLYGYTVTTAESAEAALSILERKTFDLVLSDVVMTGMDGFELAKVIRDKYSDIKIQLASGFSDNWKHPEEVEDLKINLLQKPYLKIELLKRVRSLLDES